MATDELTAEEVADAISEFKRGLGHADYIVNKEYAIRICDSHELLRADRDRLREEIAALKAELAATIAVVNPTGDQIHELERRLATAIAQRDTFAELASEGGRVVKHRNELLADRDRLREELRSANEAYAKLAAKRIMENGELAEQVETLQHSIRDPELVLRLQRELVEANEKYLACYAELTRVQADRDRLENAWDRATDSELELRAERDALREELNLPASSYPRGRLERELAEARAEIARLTSTTFGLNEQSRSS
jgi:septal ring factor EnvC (AmiA/AmiB activator)